MTKPTTEAGRRLAAPDPEDPPYNRMGFHTERCGVWGLRPCDCGLADEVRAIEKQARETCGHERVPWIDVATDIANAAKEARADLAARIEARLRDAYAEAALNMSAGPDETVLLSEKQMLAIVREEAARG